MRNWTGLEGIEGKILRPFWWTKIQLAAKVLSVAKVRLWPVSKSFKRWFCMSSNKRFLSYSSVRPFKASYHAASTKTQSTAHQPTSYCSWYPAQTPNPSNWRHQGKRVHQACRAAALLNRSVGLRARCRGRLATSISTKARNLSSPIKKLRGATRMSYVSMTTHLNYKTTTFLKQVTQVVTSIDERQLWMGSQLFNNKKLRVGS